MSSFDKRMMVFINVLVLFTAMFACREENSEPIREIPQPPIDTPAVSLKNLAAHATASTLHPALFNRRFSKNAIDGKAGSDADNGWVPRVEHISDDRPALLCLSWDKPVSVERIVLKNYQNWYLTDFVLATWESDAPFELEAPAPTFEYNDVFVKETNGYNTYRIPALVVSKKGTVLAFCEGRKDNARDVGNIDVLLKRSPDGGRSWGEQQVIYGEDEQLTIGNPVPIADRITGDIHLVFCRDAKEVFYVKSTDDGKTFSEPVNITMAVDEMCRNVGFEWTGIWTGPGHGLQMKNGRLVVPLKPAGDKQDGVSRRVGVIYSDDHGKTWKPGGIVPPVIGEMSESTLFENADGMLVHNMRWHDGLYRAVSKSADGGLTWSDPEPDLGLPDPVCQGSIYRYSQDSEDKRVFFSNLNHQETGTAFRNRLTIKLSEDDGESWPYSRQIVPGPSGYSDITVTGDGDVLVFFERGTEIYSDKLALVRMKPDDLYQRGKKETGTLRYDVELAKNFPGQTQWKEQIRVKGNTEKGPLVLTLDEPLLTNNLLLYVDGVNQPEGYIYLQEMEVWGTE